MSATHEALQAIYNETGELTPALVVERASSPEHPLHGKFCWDDTEAARRFRLVQAQGVIRSVKVEVRTRPNETVRVRAFVSETEIQGRGSLDEEERDRSRPYLPVSTVIADDVLRTAWFRGLERDWQRLRARAGASREFAEMVLADLRGDAG